MEDLVTSLERALSLHLQGRFAEAVELGQGLLGRSRGTPHAAAVHRHQAEFLLASGAIDGARRMAQEAGTLARASRHPDEILAASLVVLDCDLHAGAIAAVHQQLGELCALAAGRPEPVGAMARLMLRVGELDGAVETAERARGLLDESDAGPRRPLLELERAELLLVEGRARLLAGRPDRALMRFERVLGEELISPLPPTRARALAGAALVGCGREAEGRELCTQAVAMGRKRSADLHGQCLSAAASAHRQLGEPGLAREQLRAASALLAHPLDRQEVFFRLGDIARASGQPGEAEQALRRATDPTTETLFGRRAVRALHRLVGLRAI